MKVVSRDFNGPTHSLSVPAQAQAHPMRLLQSKKRASDSQHLSVRHLLFFYSRKPSDHSSKKSGTDHGPLGLNIIHAPKNGHEADIVFIHGLGGASRRTWSKNEDPDLFWPMKFLPSEPNVCLTRILTFGYNANFRTAGNVSTSILDFAKDLLFDLKYGRDKQKEDLNIGNVSANQAF